MKHASSEQIYKKKTPPVTTEVLINYLMLHNDNINYIYII